MASSPKPHTAPRPGGSSAERDARLGCTKRWERAGGLPDAFAMLTLCVLSATKSPFDPPAPEPVSPIEIVGGMAFLAGIAIVDVATGGLLSLLDVVPSPQGAAFGGGAPASGVITTGTATLNKDGCGNVQCTRCSVYVAYQSMSLNEHGYFCSRCTAALVASAAEE